MSSTHTYEVALRWAGDTGQGYDAYSREHEVSLAEGPVRVSADAAFRGDAALTNPEQLLLAAAASCQMLSFLAVAARARIAVLGYTDAATAVMPEDDPPLRVTAMTLRPRIVLAPGTDHDRVLRLVDLAHRECFVARSLRTEIAVEPELVDADAG